MMMRLEESKNLEAEERARLEEEIHRKKNEVMGILVNQMLNFVSWMRFDEVG